MYTNDPFLRYSHALVDCDRHRSEVHLLRPQASPDTSKLSAALKLVATVVLLLGAAAVARASQNADATCWTCTDVATGEASSAEPARRCSTPSRMPESPPND